MASTDSLPVPRKGAAYRLVFDGRKSDGTLITSGTGMDSEVSKDQGTFADCTNEATEIATNSGIYYLDLTSTEMDADCVTIKVTWTNTDALPQVIVLYPEETGDIRVAVTAISDGLLTAAKFASDFFQTIWDKATSALTTPGSIGKFLVDNIGSLISAIAGGVTSTAPVDPTSLTFTIVRGDDYSDDSGRALPEWTSDSWAALDLSAATSLTFKAKTRYGTVVFTKAMDVLSDTQVRLQLTDAETAAFDVGVGAYSYDIESVLSVAKGSDIVTLAQGKMTVLSDVR